jgi:hypothetical protein
MKLGFSGTAAVTLQAALLVFLSFGSARAQPTVSLIGASEKVCQLTGDIDWETAAPTAARTLTNFGLDAVDLGYPVENRGKLILLFGDAWPSNPGGPGGEMSPNDAVGSTIRKAVPTHDACLELTINHTTKPKLAFYPATIVGPTRISQGWFNVPSGGVGVGGALDAFFWTNHCASPKPLFPTPNDPLARPPGDAKCPETEARSSVGAGALARSTDGGHSFTYLAAMPIGFVYSLGINTQKLKALPAGHCPQGNASVSTSSACRAIARAFHTLHTPGPALSASRRRGATSPVSGPAACQTLSRTMSGCAVALGRRRPNQPDGARPETPRS